MSNDSTLSNKLKMESIIVISGPSGTGKSTLIHRLMDKYPEIVFSTSHTTRAIREKEVNGCDYHYISQEKFLEMVQADQFVEWVQVHNNYYGTSFHEIEKKAGNGKFIILDIEVQGAAKIKARFPNALFIFIVPPSFQELRNRLVGREQRLNRDVKQRLEVAKKEIKEYALYDFIIVNESLEEAFAVLDAIYIAHQHTTARREAFILDLLQSKT